MFPAMFLLGTQEGKFQDERKEDIKQTGYMKEGRRIKYNNDKK